MWALLTPKFWIGLALVAGLAFTHGFIYKSGRAAVRVEWDKERAEISTAALAASEARRIKEKALTFTNEGINRVYLKEKSALAAAVRVSDDRLRELQAAIRDTSSGDSTTAGRADDPRDAIIDQCATALVRLDADAKDVALKATGLQRYASEVCLAK